MAFPSIAQQKAATTSHEAGTARRRVLVCGSKTALEYVDSQPLEGNMKRVFVGSGLLAAAILAVVPVLRADVTTKEKTTFKMEGIMGGMVNRAMGGSDGITSTVAVKGNRMARISEKSGQIIDLGEEKVYTLDIGKKEYTVMTFAEFRQMMEEAKKRAQEQAAQTSPQDKQAAQDAAKQLEFTVDAPTAVLADQRLDDHGAFHARLARDVRVLGLRLGNRFRQLFHVHVFAERRQRVAGRRNDERVASAGRLAAADRLRQLFLRHAELERQPLEDDLRLPVLPVPEQLHRLGDLDFGLNLGRGAFIFLPATCRAAGEHQTGGENADELPLLHYGSAFPNALSFSWARCEIVSPGVPPSSAC